MKSLPAILALVSFASIGAAGVSPAGAEEFGPGGLQIGKVQFGQTVRPNKDKITIPGNFKTNFVMPTAAQADAFPGSTVTLKVNDYCRTFGPVLNKSARKRKYQAKETNPAGEKFEATFVEGPDPLKLKSTIRVQNSTHTFPTGTFPRSPRSGDPTSLAVTLVVGGVGGTYDVLNGARLPFVDPGLQTASEPLPDRTDVDLQDVWEFHGEAGQQVSLRVDTAGSAPARIDLAAELVAPDGTTVLKKADDEAACTVPTACGFGCPAIDGFVLPSTGTYRVVIHDFGSLHDGCDGGGEYSLTISKPACTAATLVEDDDPVPAICGDSIIGPGEDCEQASDCGAQEYCDSGCQCAPLCGNGTVDPGEQCENSSSCPSGQVCTGCACGVAQPLGSRSFTLDDQCSLLDTSLSPVHPTGRAKPNTLMLDAGAPDGNGKVAVSVAGVNYIAIPITIINSTTCVKLGPCTGDLYCDGGVNVNTLYETDSLAAGLTCIPDGFSCTNACEGLDVGSGNNPVLTTNPAALPASPPGSMQLTCAQQIVVVPGLNVDCTTATYTRPSLDLTYTTGKGDARVLNHCAGTAALASAIPGFSGTGEPFDCANWTQTDGPGRLVLAIGVEEVNTTFTGDGANVISFCDAAP